MRTHRTGLLSCLGVCGTSLLLASVLLGLSGSAQAQVATLKPASLNFTQAIMTTSAAQTVRLTNTGSLPLVVSSITAPSAPFKEPQPAGACSSASFSLAPNSYCTISVTFGPTSTGTFTGSISITDNAPGSPQKISLKGTGVPQAVLSPSLLVFPLIGVGTTSPAETATLQNNLNTALAITSITPGGDFTVSGTTCGASLAALSKCQISVTVTPTQLGVRSGTLTVVDSANNSPQKISLAGAGTLASLNSISVTPANLTIPVGSTQQFTATGSFPDNILLNLTKLVYWSSSATSVATISDSFVSQGLATGKAAGTTTITATSLNNVSGSTSLTVTAGGLITPTISWVPASPITYGTPLGAAQLDATASAGGTSVPGTFAYTPAAGTVLNAGTQTLSVLFTPTDTTHYTTATASVSLTVNKATATVTLGNLTQTYTGSALTPTATTAPSGLAITWTGAPDTNAGTYPVTATVNDPNYTGSASGSFVISPAAATVTLSNLTQTYTGSALTPTATTVPSGLAITWTGAPDTNAGTYPVTATVSNPNYTGSASGSFVISPAAATVTLSNLTQTYTGSALTPTATTVPSGLAITWTGAPDTNAGTYPVTATVGNPNYTGSASGSFVIGPAAATVTANAATKVFGSADPTLTASETGFTAPDAATIVLSATRAAGENVGTYTITPSATGTATSNYNITYQSATFTITQATPVFSNLTGSQSITFGTASINLAGTIAAGLVYPPSGESVSISINGSSAPATIGASGAFTTNFPTSTIPVAATPYTITYSYAGDANLAAASDTSTNLTVNQGTPPTLVSITITPANSSVALGSTLQLTATGNYSSGGPQNLTGSVTWNSMPANVATVSGGTVTPMVLGVTKITAIYQGVQGSTNVAVIGANTFMPTGPLQVALDPFTATRLNDGTVLIAGGFSGGSPQAGAELYDSTGQASTALATSMNSARADHTATLLNSGKVLIVGGYAVAGPAGVLQTAELYDPKAQNFTLTTGAPAVARAQHTATLLPDGTVLIVGGIDGNTGQPTTSAEIYNPQTDQFTGASSLSAARYGHTATLLNNGTVLITGGATNTTPTPTNIAEIYSAGAFTTTGTMVVARAFHTATLLNDGTVLLAGGLNSSNLPDSTGEIYSAGTFATPAAMNAMASPRAQHTATLLNNGMVLLAGGASDSTGTNGVIGTPTNTADLYDPNAGSFNPTSILNQARAEQTATLLVGGAVLIAGGATDNVGDTTAAAELYQPASLTPPYLQSITVTPSSPSLPVGLKQQFVATGNFNNNGMLYPQQLASVTWTETDVTGTSVAQISNSGTALALAQGTATITAGAGLITGSATVTVLPAALKSISVTPTNDFLNPGAQVQLTATGTYTDGSTNAVTQTTLWSPSNPAVAQVSNTAGSQGLVTAVSSGQDTITATDSASGISGSTTLTVSSVVPTGGGLNIARDFFTATTLVDGELLILGGYTSNGPTNTEELFSAGAFSLQSYNMINPRDDQTVTLLDNGQVLVLGGQYTFDAYLGLTAAELWPSTGMTNPNATTGSMNVPRVFNTETILHCACPNNGKVLVAGGASDATLPDTNYAVNTAELYDPVSQSFTYTRNTMTAARNQFTAVALSDGRVLVVGGQSGTIFAPTTLASADVYDPVSGLWSSAGTMNFARASATATLLNDGTVLIAGGSLNTNSAEIWSPKTNSFTLTGPLNVARINHTAVLLENGKVLISGGFNISPSFQLALLASQELYDPATGTFTLTDSLQYARYAHTANLVSDGSVLIAGGNGASGILSQAEIYPAPTSPPAGLTTITLSPAAPTIPVGATVNFTAVGTLSSGSQNLASVVWTSSDNTVVTITNDATNTGTAYAAAPGQVTITACAINICGSTTLTVNVPSWNYTEESASSNVGPRCCTAFAFDPVSDTTLLFGGVLGQFPNYSDTGDTWEFGVAGWASPGLPGPSPREGAAMVYDAASNSIVLFGGTNSSGDLNDTWIWNGTSWTQVNVANPPPARYFDGQGLTYDSNSQTVVLFGGNTANGVLGDTWTWDGVAQTWTQQSPPTSPSPRRGQGMSYDRSGNVVLFGGSDGTGSFADTWIWNGTTWMQQSPASSPTARNLHAMVFDPDVGEIVMFGGTGPSATGPNYYNDTWVWDGSNWTQVSPSGVTPGNRYAFGMDYDSAAHAIVIYGGYSSGPALQDTWELSVLP
jgi:uncharacterized protein YjdB